MILELLLKICRRLLKSLASLKLTVGLLVLSMILVYAGTCAYADTDVRTIQKNYFHSMVAQVRFQDLVPRFSDRPAYIPGGFYMPGGYLLGLALLVNLLAAHAMRWKLRWGDLAILPLLCLMLWPLLAWQHKGGWGLMWLGVAAGIPLVTTVFALHGKRGGVILLHLGVVLLLIGEGVSSGMQVESQMRIEEGASSNYSEDIHKVELAFVDRSAADTETHAVISGSSLRPGTVVDDRALPAVVQTEAYYRHSQLIDRPDGPEAVPLKRVGETEVATPSAYVSLRDRGGAFLGTFLVSCRLVSEHAVVIDGRTYGLSLRFERLYKPYRIHLNDFRFDRYPGTNQPRNYSSAVRLIDERRNQDREVRIWMNHPLRYDGETYYQASFANNETTTVFQVVRNPAVVMPYVACAVGGLGLTAHFLMMLAGFLRKVSVDALSRQKRVHRDAHYSAARGGLVTVAIVLVLGVLGIIALAARGPKAMGGKEGEFGKLAMWSMGRLKPFDSFSRHVLKALSGKESLRHDGATLTATQWALNVMTHHSALEHYRVLRIDDPDLKESLRLDNEQRYFSFKDLQPAEDEFRRQYALAAQVDEKQLATYQRAVLELGGKVNTVRQLAEPLMLAVDPPAAGRTVWRSAAEAMAHGGPGDLAAGTPEALPRILAGWKNQDQAGFLAGCAAYDAAVAKAAPEERRMARFEWFINRLKFTERMGPIWIFYILVFLLAAGSWLIWPRQLRAAATALLSLALLIHILAVVARVFITGKGPVTNLESSALFIGPVAVILGMAIDASQRKGLGTALAAVVGFVTLEIFINLTVSDDSMRVIPAVLDTNFWLWTHVPTVTMGYAASLLAGLLGLVFVLMGTCTTLLDRQMSRDWGRMIFGLTCFSILFSFVGTVLGGIWADQSWGRFWGWDPKENGAVLVVLANAVLLHARWAGLARERGLALFGIVGGVVTAWSWFGTNQLGKGLHSYGFTEGAAWTLGTWVFFNGLVLLIGLFPQRWWLSAERLSEESPPPLATAEAASP